MTDREAMKMALEALEDSMYPQKKQFDAIVGLKQALAQPEQSQTSGYAKKIESLIKERDELRQALAQPEQEPVAWIHPDGKNYKGFQSPVTTFMVDKWTPLYTAPPSKPWVSLTDDEIEAVIGNADYIYLRTCEDTQYEVFLTRAIEAALRSKNNE